MSGMRLREERSIGYPKDIDVPIAYLQLMELLLPPLVTTCNT